MCLATYFLTIVADANQNWAARFTRLISWGEGAGQRMRLAMSGTKGEEYSFNDADGANARAELAMRMAPANITMQIG
jgi:hypothetical protein